MWNVIGCVVSKSTASTSKLRGVASTTFVVPGALGFGVLGGDWRGVWFGSDGGALPARGDV